MNFLHLILMLFSIWKSYGNLNNGIVENEMQCSKNYCEDTEDTSSVQERYKKENNFIVQNINKAQRTYLKCANQLGDADCECHADVIRKDLAPFQEKGINRKMILDASNYGTRYKIHHHKLYRDSNCMFPSRCEGVEHFILKFVHQLPDMDFVVNTRDYPQVHSKFGNQKRPVFSFSKTAEYLDIMYPAWTFWAGGPAISLYPTGIGRWDLHREKISNAAAKYPWNSKQSRAFFRGSRTSDERDSIILLSRRSSDLIDAQYTKNQAWKSPKDTLNATPATEVSFQDHCRYKYLFNFRGVAASFRLKHLFLCKSLVFHVGDDWVEFFYLSLKPWVHYVPIKKYPSENDIEAILKFFQEHDDLASGIAKNGYDFIWNHLRMEDVECYWRKLLENYAKLLKFPVEGNNTMIEITAKLRK